MAPDDVIRYVGANTKRAVDLYKMFDTDGNGDLSIEEMGVFVSAMANADPDSLTAKEIKVRGACMLLVCFSAHRFFTIQLVNPSICWLFHPPPKKKTPTTQQTQQTHTHARARTHAHGRRQIQA